MSFSIPEGMFEFLNKTQIIFGNLGILKNHVNYDEI